MGVFLLPTKLCDELNALCVKFWWEQIGVERKIRWKSWSVLTQAKRVGGMGFRDLRPFDLVMLAKQGWRFLHNQELLVYRCFKARYFSRFSFLDAADSPNNSYVWKGILAGQLVLKKGICWRVSDGASIHPLRDKWIPNHPSHMILFPPTEEQWEWRVSNLIDPFLRCWDKESVLLNFHKEDVEAILRIPWSLRHIQDSVIWLHTQDGTYTIKLGNHVAFEILKIEKN